MRPSPVISVSVYEALFHIGLRFTARLARAAGGAFTLTDETLATWHASTFRVFLTRLGHPDTLPIPECATLRDGLCRAGLLNAIESVSRYRLNEDVASVCRAEAALGFATDEEATQYAQAVANMLPENLPCPLFPVNGRGKMVAGFFRPPASLTFLEAFFYLLVRRLGELIEQHTFQEADLRAVVVPYAAALSAKQGRRGGGVAFQAMLKHLLEAGCFVEEAGRRKVYTLEERAFTIRPNPELGVRDDVDGRKIIQNYVDSLEQTGQLLATYRSARSPTTIIQRRP